MLSLKNLDVFYGKTQATKDVSLKVDVGQVVALIGSNGSGKSTILRAISGLIHPRTGDILYKDHSILRKKPHEIVRAGIVHVTQERDLFPELSVFENVKLGAVVQRDRKKVQETLGEILEIFPLLKERERQKAGTLSGGEQRMLAIGRGLMSSPVLFLLDEPTSGVAPLFVKQIVDLLKLLKKRGLTMLMVEHNAPVAFSLSDYYYALRNGKVVSEGETQSLPENKNELLFRILYQTGAN